MVRPFDQERYQVRGDKEVHLAAADGRGHGGVVLTEPSSLLEMIMTNSLFD